MKDNVNRLDPDKPNSACSRGCFKALAYLLGSALVTILVLSAGALYLQVLYVTTPVRVRNVGSLPGLDYENVTLTTADGVSISGWYVPGTQPNGIVLVHGIHANRAYLIPQAIMLAEAGYHLLLIDLRGHGRSGGYMMTYGYREALDVQAAVDFLLAQPEVEQVAALGHSLGAAAVVRAAATDPRIKALVIQSSYSSLWGAIDDTFRNFSIFPKWPFAPLIVTLAEFRTGLEADQVDSARDLAAMPTRPVLIIHSVADPMFPPHHAREMYNAARSPKELWLIEGLGHVNPIYRHEAEYQERVLDFLRSAFAD